MEIRPRRVTLVLCTRQGDVLGALPAFDVPMPYWQELGGVADGARQRHGIEVTVLRLLQTDGMGLGGAVTYLAEFDGPAPTGLAPWPSSAAADHPLRQTYARPGGPAADLAWARAALGQRGTPAVGAARQLRTWNLSSIWRIPLAEGAAWLKVVPPFFAHEGALLRRLDPAPVPPVLALDGARMLLADVPGEDQYDAGLPRLLRMVQMLLAIQIDQIDCVEDLIAIGVPDWRSAPLRTLASHTFDVWADALELAERRSLEQLLATWEQRYADVASCGIPDTLVHGDLHPGNVRGDEARLVILDWGDSGIGHPLLDQSAFLERIADAEAPIIAQAWHRLWHHAIPGSDPDRAAQLLRPVAAIRHAAIYQGFLERIEPDERIYHAPDPLDWLRRTAALVRN